MRGSLVRGTIAVTIGGLLLAGLTLHVQGAAAASTTIDLPEPYSHGLRVSADSRYLPDPMVVPRSARSIRLDLADPTLLLDTASYRVYGDNFEVRGTATVSTASHSIVVPLPTDFFQVSAGHSPIRPIDSAEDFYGIEVEASGAANGPTPPSEYELRPGDGRSHLSVSVVFQAGTATSDTLGVLDLTLPLSEAWAPGGDRTYSHSEFTWTPQKQVVAAGDTITLVGAPGQWKTNFRGESVNPYAIIWYANEIDNYNQLDLPTATSLDGSRLTITIPETIDRYIYNAPPRIEIYTNTGPEGENTVETFVPIAISYRSIAPGVPVVDSVRAGNGLVDLSWGAPTTGGRVETYRVRSFSGATVVKTQVVAGRLDHATVVGLTNGRPYSFDVTATNASGSGAPSARTAIVTPRTEFVPPTVINKNPASDARSVSQTANVTAVFSEAVTNVSAASVSLRYGTTLIPAAVTYDSATRTTTLNPTSTLGPDRLYSAFISGIRDVAGNLISPMTWSFKTGPAPTIVSKTPTSGANSVAQTSNVSMVFSEPVTKVSGASISLRRAGAVIPATITYNSVTRTALLNPSSTLSADVVYTVDVTGVLDAVGNPLVATTWSFTTGPAPSVLKTAPASGATTVQRTVSPTATLSETITGYTSATVRVTQAATGATIAASVSFSSTSKILTVNPSSTLAANTKYLVTITGGTGAVRDLAGNPLATKSWTFTTGSSL